MKNVKENYEKALRRVRASQDLKEKTAHAMLAEKEAPPKKPSRKIFKAVAACAVCMVFLSAMVVVPQMASRELPNSFQIIAYAADNKKVPLKKGEKIAIARDEDKNYPFGLASARMLQDNGDHLKVGVYCNPQFICKGNNIRSITYSTTQENLSFAQMIWMGWEEACKVGATNPMEKENWEIMEEANAKRIGESYVKRPYPDEDILNPHYGDGHSVEEGDVYTKADEFHPDSRDDDYYSYLPVGKDYTINYRDQGKREYQYALRYIVNVPLKENENRNIVFWNKITNVTPIELTEGTRLKVTVTFEDDTTQTKEIQLNHEFKTSPETGDYYVTNFYVTEL